jgi:hypothetical protein
MSTTVLILLTYRVRLAGSNLSSLLNISVSNFLCTCSYIFELFDFISTLYGFNSPLL